MITDRLEAHEEIRNASRQLKAKSREYSFRVANLQALNGRDSTDYSVEAASVALNTTSQELEQAALRYATAKLSYEAATATF